MKVAWRICRHFRATFPFYRWAQKPTYRRKWSRISFWLRIAASFLNLHWKNLPLEETSASSGILTVQLSRIARTEESIIHKHHSLGRLFNSQRSRRPRVGRCRSRMMLNGFFGSAARNLFVTQYANGLEANATLFGCNLQEVLYPLLLWMAYFYFNITSAESTVNYILCDSVSLYSIPHISSLCQKPTAQPC